MKELAEQAQEHLERAKGELIAALNAIDALRSLFSHIAAVATDFEKPKKDC